MANIAFSKLNCKIPSDITPLEWEGQKIEVKKYLTIAEKIKLIEEIINNSLTEYNYANPIQIHICTVMGMVKYYTNIKFSEKQLNDVLKTYDMLVSSGLYQKVHDLVAEEEKEFIRLNSEKSIESFYAYRNSLLGILDALKLDYSDISSELVGILGQINDPNALALLKQLTSFQNGGKSR